MSSKTALVPVQHSHPTTREDQGKEAKAPVNGNLIITCPLTGAIHCFPLCFVVSKRATIMPVGVISLQGGGHHQNSFAS
jgi:hypothetical protein